MKTEHRHELATNSLAKNLEIWGEKLRPYASAIVIGIAGLFVVYALASMWSARAATQEHRAWDEYQLAILKGDNDYRGVRRVAENDELTGSRMQEWAYVAWADRQLLLASQTYLVHREEAKELLTQAAAIYKEFADESFNPLVRSRAQLGLARVSEMQGRFDDAKKHYAQVEGALAPVATQRLNELESRGKQIEEASQWLASAELPTPPTTTGPTFPGSRPQFDAQLPDADSGGTGLEPPRTMEEILGGATGNDSGAPRYGEGDAAPPATSGPADAVPADDDLPAAGESAAGDSAPPAAQPAEPQGELTPANDSSEKQ